MWFQNKRARTFRHKDSHLTSYPEPAGQIPSAFLPPPHPSPSSTLPKTTGGASPPGICVENVPIYPTQRRSEDDCFNRLMSSSGSFFSQEDDGYISPSLRAEGVRQDRLLPDLPREVHNSPELSQGEGQAFRYPPPPGYLTPYNKCGVAPGRASCPTSPDSACWDVELESSFPATEQGLLFSGGGGGGPVFELPELSAKCVDDVLGETQVPWWQTGHWC